ncbi:MAG: alpha-amylase [Deltaproteobacteria bacterium]|nr:alpha-amylase [Deltaproteobacteria bacterium]
MPTSLFSSDFRAILNAAALTRPGAQASPFPSPIDWRDQWIYFLMVDRFNSSKPPLHLPFDDPNYFAFQGGKFSGIRTQLHYIKQLGAGSIWISPALKNLKFDQGTYHGYGIHDFLRAEPRFADNPDKADDELRQLVDAAHNEGLFVIFDIVLNHTGDVFAYANGSESFHPDPQPVFWRDANGVAQAQFTDVATIPNPSLDAVVWPKELQQNRFFRRQGNPGSADDTVGDFASLKQMMTGDPELQRFLIRAYQYVIARYDVDGFRIDTLRYLKGGLPQLFGNAVREFALSIGKKNFFTFGEVLDSSEETDIARFIGRNTSDQTDMVGVDAALDYPLFTNLKPMVKGFAPPSSVVAMYHLRKSIEQDILSSHGDATRFFVTFLDNHDMKERIRYEDPQDPTKYDDQVTLGLACLFSLPGIPCVYYGTEQGLHGHGTDPAVREALWGGPGFNQDSKFFGAIKQIAQVRATQAALRYGRFYFRPVSGDGHGFAVSNFTPGVLAFSRILNDEEVLVAANASTSQTIDLDVIVEIQLSSDGDRFQVLYSNQATPILPQPVRTRGPGTVNVQEVDGSSGTGPLHVVHVTLRPLEVQILRNAG